MSEIMKQLQAPFYPEDIEWRVGSTNKAKTSGLALAYVTNRAIQNRLDDVFGPFGWQNEFKEWKGNSQICGISVWDEQKKQWITKWDGADDSQTEAVKGGLSDSMKRAGYQWGIGRYLYKLPSVWMPIKQQGKSYVLTETPQLPAWALPEGYNYPKQQPITSKKTEATPTADTPSEAQLKKLYALSKEKNLSVETMQTIMLERYTKENSKDLTKKETSDLITFLEGDK